MTDLADRSELDAGTLRGVAGGRSASTRVGRPPRTEFRYPGRPFVGRQSQTWLRTDGCWRIAHAHASEIGGPAS